MRIDINLRLRVCGIDASLNQEERAAHIFFDSKNLSETEGCIGKATEWPTEKLFLEGIRKVTTKWHKPM